MIDTFLTYLAKFDLVVAFFFLGALARKVKTDLVFPKDLSQFLVIYLMVCLGLKGGYGVAHTGQMEGFFWILGLGLASCIVIPLYLCAVLRRQLPEADGLAIGAAYGSVSAITFITALNVLNNEGVKSSEFMVAVMAVMEIPAILVTLFLYSRRHQQGMNRVPIFSSKSVVLILGSFAIGLLMNKESWESVQPVVQGAFKGALIFFLLDLGLRAVEQTQRVRSGWSLCLGIGVLLPLIHGTLALLAAHSLAVPHGDRVLLATLVGSASYIAAPAAMRASLPPLQTNLDLSLPLGVTFPVNVVLGIPYYIAISEYLTQ